MHPLNTRNFNFQFMIGSWRPPSQTEFVYMKLTHLEFEASNLFTSKSTYDKVCMLSMKNLTNITENIWFRNQLMSSPFLHIVFTMNSLKDMFLNDLKK